MAWGLLALAAPAARAADHYVSESGSDAGPGTLTRPWRTLSHAARAVRPGDAVYVRAGVYGGFGTETVLGTSGAADAPISWLGFPGESRPVFRGQLRVSGAYNQVSGFVFEGPTGPIEGEEGIPVWLNGTGATLSHSEVFGSKWHAGVFVSGAQGFSIDHDYIHDNGVRYNLDHGIYVSSDSSGTIVDDLIVRNRAWGVSLFPDPSGVVVNHDTILENGRGGVIVSNGTAESLVVNSVIADNAEYGIRGYRLSGEGNVARDNLVWGQQFDLTGSGVEFSENLIAPPRLVSRSDPRPLGSSPAIGRGVAPGVPDDLDGTPRAGREDLGAYQYVAAASPLIRALALLAGERLGEAWALLFG